MEKPIDVEQYTKALATVAEAQQASISMLQRRMKIGYSTAARIVEQMEKDGHIGPYEGSKPRVVHIKPDSENKPQKKASKPPARKKTPAKGKGAKTTKKAPQQPRKKGRPPLWYELDMPNKLDAVRGWCMQGATMEELAEMIGASTTTLYEWRQDYPEFADTLRAGRHVANGELLAAAFRASSGFHMAGKAAVKFKTYKEFKDPKTGRMELKPVEEVAVVDVSEYVPPNAQLLQFMLTNRLPGQYKKKEHIEHGGLGGAGGYEYMSDEELDAAINELEGGGSE